MVRHLHCWSHFTLIFTLPSSLCSVISPSLFNRLSFTDIAELPSGLSLVGWHLPQSIMLKNGHNALSEPLSGQSGFGGLLHASRLWQTFWTFPEGVLLLAVRHHWLMFSCGPGRTPAPVYTTDLQTVTPYLLFTQLIAFDLCLILLLLIYIVSSSTYFRRLLWL